MIELLPSNMPSNLPDWFLSVSLWKFFYRVRIHNNRLDYDDSALGFLLCLDWNGIKWFLRYTILSTFFSRPAIFLSRFIISFQVASLGESWRSGGDHLLFALQRRTCVKTGYLSPEFGADFPNLIQVIWLYLKGSFFNISNYFNIQNPVLARVFHKIRYFQLVLIFLVASWIIRRQRTWADSGIDGRRRTALVVSTWFSLLTPLS